MTAIDYSTLKPGDEGFWPVIGATPDDIRPGDRFYFGSSEDPKDVTVVASAESNGVQIKVVDTDGKRWTVGRMARDFNLDRRGTHGTLGMHVR